jgi:hypothetical protein
MPQLVVNRPRTGVRPNILHSKIGSHMLRSGASALQIAPRKALTIADASKESGLASAV